MTIGAVLEPGELRQADGWSLLVEDRKPGAVAVHLGPHEEALLADMPYPLRRSEWLAGRKVAKTLLEKALGLVTGRVEVLPKSSGAPMVMVDGKERRDIVLNISHTRAYAAAAVSKGPVGVDVCDLVDGPRLVNIARRVFSPGEVEACGAHRSSQTQAAVWSIKEAVLKLSIGGVFDPGARSVFVTSLEPATVKDPSVSVTLYRLPTAMLTLALPK